MKKPGLSGAEWSTMDHPGRVFTRATSGLDANSYTVRAQSEYSEEIESKPSIFSLGRSLYF